MSRPREFDVDHTLHQCMEVFWTKGFKSTSYEDLTRTTGVKKQSLYCVFNDKRSLFLKALAHYREQNIAALEELEAQDTSPLNKLESLRLSILRDEIMSRGCLMVNSAMEFGTEDEPITREIELMFAETERILERIIRSAQEQQLITTRFTSQELATYLNNAILGARTLGKSGASPEQIEAALNTSFTMILP
ncbi:TetR/AcrR family transcriptional regulator [Paenibacillus sp. P96]|uniref:TetR/AcrR family transcriptional regulator n=1 Tax=Paenibacillus zeirhizosphaerae TaxID=2987519 RepID=A0ABT9FM64_9BACL|nr:TetR/AcrR family transcriptional regulator [Paenibacillus sp. P96]MDP4095836.1 TetR/AcrR family transcriptional regulator [Paenibacillus sp. P96]